jgi:hypothetical protein
MNCNDGAEAMLKHFVGVGERRPARDGAAQKLQAKLAGIGGARVAGLI